MTHPLCVLYLQVSFIHRYALFTNVHNRQVSFLQVVFGVISTTCDPSIICVLYLQVSFIQRYALFTNVHNRQVSFLQVAFGVISTTCEHPLYMCSLFTGVLYREVCIIYQCT